MGLAAGHEFQPCLQYQGDKNRNPPLTTFYAKRGRNFGKKQVPTKKTHILRMEKNKFAREARENFGKKQVPARSAGKIWGIFSFPWILGAKSYIKNTKIGSRAARRKFWQKIGSRVKIGGNFGKKQVRARSARNLKMGKNRFPRIFGCSGP